MKPIRDPKYRAYIRQLPCLSCGYRPSEAAHVGGLAEGKGMGQKASDDTCVPLCTGCHIYAHRVGQNDFERYRSVSLLEIAARLWRQYKENHDRKKV